MEYKSNVAIPLEWVKSIESDDKAYIVPPEDIPRIEEFIRRYYGRRTRMGMLRTLRKDYPGLTVAWMRYREDLMKQRGEI